MILRKELKNLACYCTVAHSKKVVKYTDTVLLPKTKFPHYLNAKQTEERDKRIFEVSKKNHFIGLEVVVL